MFVYQTLPSKGKETVRHGQPSLESSLEAEKMPEDETDNSNGKDIKQPESEPKVVTTIINSSFHTYIHTYHWFPQFLTLAMVTSNCYQLQTRSSQERYHRKARDCIRPKLFTRLHNQ